MTLEITTARLRLVPFRDEDATDIAALGDDPEVARMMTSIPIPFTPADAARRIAGSRPDGRPGFLLAIRLTDGTLVGETGIWGETSPELMYWLGRDYWGRGYATEAAIAMIDETFTRFGPDTMTGGTYDGNPASEAILTRLGFEKTERFFDDDSLGRSEPAGGWVWRLTRAVWDAREGA